MTSNHIHLLILDSGGDVIPKSMQLVAGRTAREYNLRKKRRGACWEDRYHATAVEAGQHFAKCIVYIDMNMIRAGIVKHPEEWQHRGYKEIQDPHERYRIVDSVGLMGLLSVNEFEQLRTLRHDWIEAALGSNQLNRESLWTEGIAVGSQDYIETIKINLGAKAYGRQSVFDGETCMLREPRASYDTHFPPKIDGLSLENSYYWDVTVRKKYVR